MQNKTFCQSCSMPLDDPAMLGTEKDGSKNREYCKYCYHDGAFVNPGMTLEEMTTVVITQMQKRNIDQKIINMAVGTLPHLKRWAAKPVQLQTAQ